MGKIKILPDVLCNQIAAGEVVERPAAVVKELMENSIDAQSTTINLSLLQGGRKEVRVADNGFGMEPDDALLALERHATSKLRDPNQLQAIRSLGFRGEALPSIAAVSRFELVTREADALSATQIRVEGGRILSVAETGAPPGTTIQVRDLFFNLPARRKFLRSVETEMAHISDQFIRIALAHPEIHLRLSHQGRKTYDLPRVTDLGQRTGQLFGHKLSRVLVPFHHDHGTVQVRGLLSPPELQRSNTRSLFIYVNNRPVRDRSLNHAVFSAYDTLLAKGRYPFIILFIDIAPEAVDVNVHPTKREVRFRRPREVLNAVRSTLEASLTRLGEQTWNKPFFLPPEVTTPTPATNIHDGQQAFIPAQVPRAQPPAGTPASSAPTAPASGIPSAGPTPGAPVPADPASPPGDQPRFQDLEFIAQLENVYLLFRAPDGLIFIDQHAAHERILFDKLADRRNKLASQRLTQPAVVDLLPLEAEALRRCLEQLREMGFEVEPFGGTSFVVHAVPAVLDRHPPEALIRDLLGRIDLKTPVPEPELLASMAKTAACHQAIRAGQKLAAAEIRELLKELDATRLSATCPHGRPAWWKLTYDEIQRVFHRS